MHMQSYVWPTTTGGGKGGQREWTTFENEPEAIEFANPRAGWGGRGPPLRPASEGCLPERAISSPTGFERGPQARNTGCNVFLTRHRPCRGVAVRHRRTPAGESVQGKGRICRRLCKLPHKKRCTFEWEWKCLYLWCSCMASRVDAITIWSMSVLSFFHCQMKSFLSLGHQLK